jgi:serine/threonine protein kinase
MRGTLLGDRYLLAEELGSGGMGTVYRALDQRTGGQVAVKIPHAWLVIRDPTFTTRLRREAEIAASLNSSRVVRVFDFDFWDDRPYLVMEYVPGQTLAEVLDERGVLGWQEAARIALEVARALDAAHQRRIVHRDLKPENIKLDESFVKVLDFGIARAEGLSAITVNSVFVGTPEYTAPERFGMDTEPGNTPSLATTGDIRSDIYSLGIILYQMLAGVPPFTGSSIWAVIRAHERSQPAPLDESIPESLRAVVARCLAKQREHRYQEPRELVSALARVLADDAPDLAEGRDGSVAGTDAVALPHQGMEDPQPSRVQGERAEARDPSRAARRATEGSAPPAPSKMVAPSPLTEPRAGEPDGAPLPTGVPGSEPSPVVDSTGAAGSSSPEPASPSILVLVVVVLAVGVLVGGVLFAAFGRSGGPPPDPDQGTPTSRIMREAPAAPSETALHRARLHQSPVILASSLPRTP